MSVIHVTDADFQAKVIDSTQTVLVDFWAPWCGPCRMMGPIVDELAGELGSGALVVKVNIDEAPDAAARFGIRSIPTFAVFSGGEVRNHMAGVFAKQELADAVQAVLA